MPITSKIQMPKLTLAEQLCPITELTDAESVSCVYRDIVRCHRRLFDECETLHGDIRLDNLMYCMDGPRIRGVLNDFDLARCHDLSTGPQSEQRTGTRQFMAVDLLDPKRSHTHLYRHDLESIFYVMVFHLCGYHQGEEIEPPLFQEWLELPSQLLRVVKVDFLSEPMQAPTERFTPLASWLTELADMFSEGYTARKRYDRRGDTSVGFDRETLDGHVTFTTFKKIVGIE